MKKEENKIEFDGTVGTVDLRDNLGTIEEEVKQPKKVKKPKVVDTIKKESEEDLFNCLQNKKVIVRFISNRNNKITDKSHVIYGGMHQDSFVRLVVPTHNNGMFVNVLTDKEKAFLESLLNVNLSIYLKHDNFWDCSNESGINYVDLKKQDNYLDLSDPEDYIRYKILLANKHIICPSMEDYRNIPKASYRFVIVEENEVDKSNTQKLSSTMKAYEIFGKIKEDKYKLITIVEILEGRPIDSKTSLEFLQSKCYDIITNSAKEFVKVADDEYLDNKILLKKALEVGAVTRRNNLYFLKDGDPLCDVNQDATLSVAAAYLARPKNQELKFMLEEKVK